MFKTRAYSRFFHRRRSRFDFRALVSPDRLVVGYFDSLSSLYLRGQPKFSSIWRGLRDAWTHKRPKPRERASGVHLQRYVRATAGRWLPLCWPPLHGIMLGDTQYFGVVRDHKTYRRFSCLRQAGRLYFIGLVSVYECVPDANTAPEIWVSGHGHAFAYLPGEDKVYVLGLSFGEFFENGLFAVYSFFERDYVDEIVEGAWFKHTFAGMYELSQILHDRANPPGRLARLYFHFRLVERGRGRRGQQFCDRRARTGPLCSHRMDGTREQSRIYGRARRHSRTAVRYDAG